MRGSDMKKLVRGLAFAMTLVAVATNEGQAAPVLNNGSFEFGTNPGDSFIGPLFVGDGSINNWDITGGSIDYIGGYWNAQDGSRSIDLNGTSPGTISQTVTGLDVGKQYKVSFW